MRPLVSRLTNEGEPWPDPYRLLDFRPVRYRIGRDGVPVFHYEFGGARIEDTPRAVDGKGFERRLRIGESVPNLHVLLAEADEFELVKPGLYAADDRRYYIRVQHFGKVFVRDSEGHAQLLATPGADNSLNYEILF